MIRNSAAGAPAVFNPPRCGYHEGRVAEGSKGRDSRPFVKVLTQEAAIVKNGTKRSRKDFMQLDQCRHNRGNRRRPAGLHVFPPTVMSKYAS
jgi:hypothetical protein